MEIRKLQRTGGSSLAMTLPKKWIDDFALQDKDQVAVHFQKSGSLIIQPRRLKDQLLATTLLLKNLNQGMVARELVAHYMSGSDQVSIEGKKITKDQRKAIREVCQLLLGFEITEESSNQIIINNIFDVTKFPIIQNIDKMFLIATSMFADAIESLVRHNQTLSRDIIDRDIEINKLHLVIRRQFYKIIRDRLFDEEINLSQADMKYYENIAIQLERIADHAVKIARTVTLVDKKLTKDVASRLVSLAKKTILLLKSSQEMVKKTDKVLAHRILDKKADTEKTFSLSSGAVSVQEAVIIDSLDLLHKRIMNMAEATIDQVIVRDQLLQ